MYGEFKIYVNKQASEIISALTSIYPGNDLQQTFSNSQFCQLFPIGTFIFGVTTTDVFILVSITNRVVTVCLENPKNKADLTQIKNRIDYYHNEITEALRTKRIKASQSKAIISMDSFELAGVWTNRWSAFREEFSKSWKPIILTPTSRLILMFVFWHYDFFTQTQASDKNIDAVFGFIPGFIGFLFTLLGILLSKKSHKKFSFTI